MAIIERSAAEREVQIIRDLLAAQRAYDDLLPPETAEYATTTVLTSDYFDRLCEAEEAITHLTRELRQLRERLYANQRGGV
jgi:hypothetical protein